MLRISRVLLPKYRIDLRTELELRHRWAVPWDFTLTNFNVIPGVLMPIEMLSAALDHRVLH